MILLFLAISCSFMSALAQELPVMITFYTPSHEVLYKNYFLPSFYKSGLDKHFRLDVHEFEQESVEASYMSSGWNSTMMRKVDLILDTIDKNWGKVFVYADIDIQFFRLFAPKEYLKDGDIVFQRNYSQEYEDLCKIKQLRRSGQWFCAGFFIARANEAVRRLWNEVRSDMKNNPKLDDQGPLNCQLLNRRELSYIGLDSIFFNPALSQGAGEPIRWVPKQVLSIPSNIILHHANWTVGIENKIKQLDYIKSIAI